MDMSEMDYELFKGLVEESLVGHYLNDGKRFFYSNKAFSELFGYSPAELETISPVDLVVPEDRELVAESLEKRLSGEIEADRFVVRGLRKDGSTFWAEIFGKRVEHQGAPAIMGTAVDISERRRMEEEVRNSKETLERVVNTIRDLVVLLDKDLKITLANPAVFKAIKRPAEDFMGRYCYEIFQNRDSICEDCPAVEAAKTGRVVHRMRHNPDGTVLDRRIYPIFDERGEPCETLIVASDVTERYLAEEALKRSESFYRSLMNDVIDSSMVGVFILDADFNVVWLNRAAEDFFGIQREKVIGKSKRKLVSSVIKQLMEDGEQFESRVLAAYEDNTCTESFVCHVLSGEGREERWLEHWSQPIESGPFAGGRIEHYYDITAQRRAEKRLQENEEFLRALLSSIEDGILVLDRDMTILYANSAVKSWHPTSTPLVGEKCYHAFQGIDVPCDECPVRSCMETGRMEMVRKSARYPDGSLRWLELHAYPFRDSQGNLRGVVELIKDVTELRSLEEQLHLAQRMEAIGRLAGGIAHDFNNILMVILGSCELLMEDAERLSPEMLDRLEMIDKAAKRAADLTRQLLVFSKRQIVEPKVLDLNQEISEIKRMLERVIEENIELNISLCPMPCTIKVDPAQMDQVVMNLVMNAKEAMPKGGSLSITTQIKRIDDLADAARLGVEPGSYAVLSVKDTGVGMDEETRKKIFEPFFTTKEGGTGLGLATVYGVVSQLRGAVSYHSEPGKGTVFEVYLPLVEEAASKEEEATTAAVCGGAPGKVVLVVEDEDSVRMLTVAVLRKCGYLVLEASNGEEALGILRERDVDLLLTDVVMPVMGGVELAMKARELHPDLKVIFMSGYPSEDVEFEDFLHNMRGADFVSKPFSRHRLLEKVRGMLGD